MSVVFVISVHLSFSNNPLAARESTFSEFSYDMNSSLGSVTSPGIPIHTSLPVKQINAKQSFDKGTLSVLNVNCQSIRAKKEIFHITINNLNPDIVIGTESWLKDTDLNCQVFPDNYQIERRDRATDPHGGVFIACKQNIILEREHELETDCEIMWCRVTISGRKSIHVRSIL